MLDKFKLRAALTARRAIAFDACPDAGEQLAARFPFPIFKHVVVAGYMPFRTEIDPFPLMCALVRQGAQLSLPRMNSPSHLCGFGVHAIVGVGGGATDPHSPPITSTAPHPPTPSPQVGRGEALMLYNVNPEIRSSFTQANSPSHLWGGVGVGGGLADTSTALVTNTAPHPPAPSPQGGRGGALMSRNFDLKIQSSFAQANSPSHLCGFGVHAIVGVGGGLTDTHTTLVTTTAPNPPAPSPQVGRGEVLTFHLCDIDDPSHFQKNKWGLLEPRADLPTATPTILLVPLLGFDRQGNRLGYGKGYYDATIQALKSQGPVTTIGLAFAEQEVPEIPTQPHDQRLDWIITQNEAYRVPS